MKIKHLETENFTFFIDLAESDENAAVEIYNKAGEFVSDNIHAYNFIFRILEGKENEKIIYISDELTEQKNRLENENL